MIKYEVFTNDILSTLAYMLLGLSLVSIFINKRMLINCIILSLTASMLAERVAISTALGVLMFYLFSKWLFNMEERRTNVYFLFVFASISSSLYFHIFPGFDNWIVYKDIKLSEVSTQFNLYFNFDKPIVGMMLGLILYNKIKKENKINITRIKQILTYSALCILVVSILSILLDFIEPDLKYNNLFFLWACKNLFFVCITEEIFFRKFILGEVLVKYLKLPVKSYNQPVAIILSSVFFGIFHYNGGAEYIFLSAVAGLFYGYAYIKTGNILSSICVHFMLNSVHYLAFSYPRSM